MEMVKEFLTCLLAIIISSIIFNIIFIGLNESMLQLFVPIQKLVANIKNKRLVKFIIFIATIILCTTIKDIFNFNYIVFGILIGFFNALTDVIFGIAIEPNKNENI